MILWNFHDLFTWRYRSLSCVWRFVQIINNNWWISSYLWSEWMDIWLNIKGKLRRYKHFFIMNVFKTLESLWSIWLRYMISRKMWIQKSNQLRNLKSRHMTIANSSKKIKTLLTKRIKPHSIPYHTQSNMRHQ
jgi:hypothetical protein